MNIKELSKFPDPLNQLSDKESSTLFIFDHDLDVVVYVNVTEIVDTLPCIVGEEAKRIDDDLGESLTIRGSLVEGHHVDKLQDSPIMTFVFKYFTDMDW